MVKYGLLPLLSAWASYLALKAPPSQVVLKDIPFFFYFFLVILFLPIMYSFIMNYYFAEAQHAYGQYFVYTLSLYKWNRQHRHPVPFIIL